MSHWIDLRKRAREQYKTLLSVLDCAPTAAALLKAAERVTQIKPVGLPQGDSLLAGAEAVLDPEAKTIWFNKDVDSNMAAFYQMHEYAHFWIHGGRRDCGKADIDAEASEEDTPFGLARVESYSPDERAEREANVFAREVLLPTDVLRQWFLSDAMNAVAISEFAGLPAGMVYHQLAYALLVSDLEATQKKDEKENSGHKLDDSQREAAEWTASPLLVEAGPGTGKTSTLVGRMQFLLGRGTPPASILALTFSNKAAEEMRSRVAAMDSIAASQIWMGTFHAFGLELLRKYGHDIGLPVSPSILDPVDALFLLESALPLLNLDRYQNLYEPTMHLRSILGAISRAKDELFGPEEYTKHAQEMRGKANTEEEIVAAEKALEVARVYDYYQGYLNCEHLLDFGDLILKSAMLLRTRPDIRDEIQTTYDHILVDEYQDVNRASGLLLREIAGGKKGLWVVGDTRQSIYRFRGASPANMRLFARDFPGSEIRSLKYNYRSQQEIVKVFSTLAPQMEATKGHPFIPWEPKRQSSLSNVHVKIANNLDAEAQGIADEINRHVKDGIQYREQAILCRSHTMLARIASRLELAGVPILYLGDLFERPEIRDLLSLISLSCDGRGSGLIRVAQFPEYGIPLDDVRILLKSAGEKAVYFPQALKMGLEIPEISEKGKSGFGRLFSHTEQVNYRTTAWDMLVRYLFDSGKYLKPYTNDGSAAGQQKRLAIYQFLQFAHEQRGRPIDKSENPRRGFLEYVRRLEIYGEEKQLRQVPDWASGIDSVRLLTVHASKGLEFKVVYLPGLGQGYFPARRQGNVCPAPVGMIPEHTGDGGHAEEEECLFFVALSRARDVLCLSRADQYGAMNSNPSSLLSLIKGSLPHPPDGRATWITTGDRTVELPFEITSKETPTYDVHELDVYITCPRRYYYEFILGLGGRRENTAYVQFHKCVYQVVRWMGTERLAGRPVDENLAHLKLREIWKTAGPCDHPYETIYRRDAEMMVARAVERLMDAETPVEPPIWELSLSNGKLQVRPDYIEEASGRRKHGSTAYRIRTGRPNESETQKNIYAAYVAAAEQARPGPTEVQVMYLSTGDITPVQISKRSLQTRLNKYNSAIQGILQKRYLPDHDDRECPRCSHYFICPAP